MSAPNTNWRPQEAAPLLGNASNRLKGSALVGYVADYDEAAGRSVLDKLDDFVNVKDFGVTGNGSDDDTDAIQSAITTLSRDNRRTVLYFPPGTYRISSTITWYVNAVSIVGTNAKIDASRLASTTAIFATTWTGRATAGEHSVGQFYNNGQTIFEGIDLCGPMKSGDTLADGTVVGIQIDADNSNDISHVTVRNCSIHGFQYGFEFKDNAYNWQFLNNTLFRCWHVFHWINGYTNAGERITIHGGTLFNSTVIFYLTEPDVEFYVHGASIDYNTQVCDITQSKLFLTDCHIEMVMTGAVSFFDVNGNGGLLEMRGGFLLGAGTTTGVPSVVDIEYSSTTAFANAYFLGVFMHNLRMTTFATGGGRCYIKDTVSYSTSNNNFTVGTLATAAQWNAIPDGGFEDATIKADVFISADTAAITSRTSGTNITIAQSTTYARTGSKSLRISTVAAGAASATVVVPCSRNDHVIWDYYIKMQTAGLIGMITFNYGYANTSVNADGVPVLLNKVAYASNTHNPAGTIDWGDAAAHRVAGKGGITFNSICPHWANCAYLEIVLGNLSAAIDLYIDDMVVGII